MARMQETLTALNERLEIIDRRQSLIVQRRKVAHDGDEGEEDTDGHAAASQDEDGPEGSKSYL